jgi:hypothetical protein
LRKIIATLLVFFVSINATAAVTWYTNEADWLAASGAASSFEFEFTASNVTLSNEISTAPVTQTNLGVGQLTFDDVNTGAPADFAFTDTGTHSSYNNVWWGYGDWIFSGTSTDHDFTIELGASSTQTAFGFRVYAGANDFAINPVSLRDTSGALLSHWVPGTPLPFGTHFIGAVSDVEIGSLVWSDSSASGGPSVEAVYFTAVPVPAAVWLFGSGLSLLGWFRRRQTT